MILRFPIQSRDLGIKIKECGCQPILQKTVGVRVSAELPSDSAAQDIVLENLCSRRGAYLKCNMSYLQRVCETRSLKYEEQNPTEVLSDPMIEILSVLQTEVLYDLMIELLCLVCRNFLRDEE